MCQVLGIQWVVRKIWAIMKLIIQDESQTMSKQVNKKRKYQLIKEFK